LRVIGNILSGDENQTQQVLDSSILPIFHKLLIQSNRLDFKKEICWSISNITAGSTEQLQIVLNSNILNDIISLGLNSRTSPDLLKECIFCISNATHLATNEQMDLLIEIQSLEFLFHVIDKVSRKNLPIVLEGIANILQKKPNAIERIKHEDVKVIPSIACLSGDSGKLGKRLIELIPSHFAGLVLRDDMAQFEGGAEDEEDEWGIIDEDEEEYVDEEGGEGEGEGDENGEEDN
jgi:hypothetical protein